MSFEDLTPAQRADIARNFKQNERNEALLQQLEQDPTATQGLTANQKIEFGIYKRDRAVAEQEAQKK